MAWQAERSDVRTLLIKMVWKFEKECGRSQGPTWPNSRGGHKAHKACSFMTFQDLSTCSEETNVCTPKEQANPLLVLICASKPCWLVLTNGQPSKGHVRAPPPGTRRAGRVQ